MEIAEHWVHRARPKEQGSAVGRVGVLRAGERGRTGWLHVRSLEDEVAGLQEWVNPASLVARWEDAEAFHSDDATKLTLAEASRPGP